MTNAIAVTYLGRMQELDTLIGTAEAAELLGDKHVRQFLRRVERGDITPAMKLPGLRGAYLFDRKAVLAQLPPMTPAPVSPEATGAGVF